jgi:hypothetical protein
MFLRPNMSQVPVEPILRMEKVKLWPDIHGN